MSSEQNLLLGISIIIVGLAIVAGITAYRGYDSVSVEESKITSRIEILDIDTESLVVVPGDVDARAEVLVFPGEAAWNNLGLSAYKKEHLIIQVIAGEDTLTEAGIISVSEWNDLSKSAHTKEDTERTLQNIKKR